MSKSYISKILLKSQFHQMSQTCDNRPLRVNYSPNESDSVLVHDQCPGGRVVFVLYTH